MLAKGAPALDTLPAWATDPNMPTPATTTAEANIIVLRVRAALLSL
jgi:hypothetical protein